MLADDRRRGEPGGAQARLLSYGHGTATAAEILEHLHGAGVGVVVDVRAYPGSRRNPHVARERMADWLPAAGIGYVWLGEQLGGRRKLTPDAAQDSVWRHPAFRAYAAWMREPDFSAGIDRLLELGEGRSAAFMCSEAVWWKCHRRLVSDFLTVARGLEVHHLMHDGRTPAHAPTEGCRLRPDGLLVYDGGEPTLYGEGEGR